LVIQLMTVRSVTLLPVLESAIVRTILRKLNALPGCYARKMHGGPYSAGLPDVFCCYQGHLLALEVKRPGGRLTALQAAELDRWRAAGATAAVVTSWADVERVLALQPPPLR
jgi:hypothetical protein